MGVEYRAIDWLDWLPGDLYRVGSDGTIDRRGKPLKPFLQTRTTVCIGLAFAGKTLRPSVASLVLRAFIGPRPIGCIPLHFPDRDPYNNCLSNLRWAPRGATNVGQSRGLPFKKGESHANSVLGDHQIPLIRGLLNMGWSQKQIADWLGVSKGTVHDIAHNISWTHIPLGAPVRPDLRRFLTPPPG